METAKLERAYQTFLICREVIHRSTSEQQMFQTICDAAVSRLGYRLAWIGVVSDTDERVHPVAQAGYEDGYLEAIEVSWADDERGQGPTGRAIRECRSTVSQDLATDERFAPWRADALKRGYGSSAALPFFDGSRCIGTINLYAAEPDAFDDDEMALLEELAVDVQLGIQRHRMQMQLESMSLQLEHAIRAEAATSACLALSHDINNMVQLITLALAQARRTQDPATRDEALEAAESAAGSVAGLSRQILSVGRRGSISDTDTDVDNIIRGSSPLLARLAPRAELELDLEARNTRAQISSIDLERILINLVINAGHAMPSGGRLRVSTARRTLTQPTPTPGGPVAPGSYVAVSVDDEGEGIDPDTLPHIFKPFFTTKDEYGTGLGLPAVLHLARSAGGGMEVDTEVGRGTCIVVLLPVAEPPSGD